MIEDSISIVNVMGCEVSDNRYKINKLISSLKTIVVSMVNAIQGLDKQVSKLEILMHRHWLYKTMVDREIFLGRPHGFELIETIAQPVVGLSFFPLYNHSTQTEGATA